MSALRQPDNGVLAEEPLLDTRPVEYLAERLAAGYLPQMRTQIIAARTVAEALAAMATSPEAEFAAARAAESAGAPIAELAGPREENLASLARLVAARRGDQVRIEEVTAADPDSQAAADGSLLPGPHAKLAGPTFEQWLTTQPDSGSAA
jgi:hypothetical protein